METEGAGVGLRALSEAGDGDLVELVRGQRDFHAQVLRAHVRRHALGHSFAREDLGEQRPADLDQPEFQQLLTKDFTGQCVNVEMDLRKKEECEMRVRECHLRRS